MSNITVYTSPSCGPCAMVKRWLQSNNLEYTEATLEDAVAKGYRSVPIVEHPYGSIAGFNMQKLMDMKEKLNGAI